VVIEVGPERFALAAEEDHADRFVDSLGDFLVELPLEELPPPLPGTRAPDEPDDGSTDRWSGIR
jgi:hypothetical protein